MFEVYPEGTTKLYIDPCFKTLTMSPLPILEFVSPETPKLDGNVSVEPVYKSTGLGVKLLPELNDAVFGITKPLKLPDCL